MAKNTAKRRDSGEARDQANKRRFVDQSGLAAQDLPDAKHGQNAVPDAHEMKRTLPQQHGGFESDPNNYDEGGIRAALDSTDADRHGHRKKN
jgi:hypothetical protein